MKLNIVEFNLEHHKTYEGFEYSKINISVDGTPLIYIMREIELTMAKQEGETATAGNYSSLPLPKFLIEHFLGEDDAVWGSSDDKTELLECICECPACWPLLCNIEVTNGIVIWKNFEQPNRSIDSHIHWDYSAFEGFCFDKALYLKALKQIAAV